MIDDHAYTSIYVRWSGSMLASLEVALLIFAWMTAFAMGPAAARAWMGLSSGGHLELGSELARLLYALCPGSVLTSVLAASLGLC
jgi:hypothetical protein